MWVNFQLTLNFLIRANFKFRRSVVVKNVQFQIFNMPEISWIGPISIFAGPRWSKMSIFSQILKAIEISWLSQISSFAGLRWSKMSNFKFLTAWNLLNRPNFYFRRYAVVNFQSNFKSSWNFLIRPNINFRRSAVVKNFIFQSNFQSNWNFLIGANFRFPRSAVVKKVKFQSNF